MTAKADRRVLFTPFERERSRGNPIGILAFILNDLCAHWRHFAAGKMFRTAHFTV
jgi:hypothetical protein